MQLAEKRPITIEWGFIGLFVLYISIFAGVLEMNRSALLAFREFTASAIAALWGIFTTQVACSGTQLTFVGFAMEIVLECTALHYMIIYIAGVLAFRSHTVSYRAAGIFLGILLIFLLNMFRIGIIGFIGRYYSDVFTFVHEYLWQGMFALSVILLWMLWVNGRRMLSRRIIVLLFAVLATASLSFWLATRLLETYISLLAALSNVLFPIVSVLVDVPQKVIADGKLIGYVVGNTVIYSKTTLYVLNAALLLPIASLTFVWSQKKLFLQRLSAAALLLIAQHLLIILLDWLLEVTAGPEIHSVIVWCIVMSTFIAPMLVWLLVMKIFRAEPSSKNNSSHA